MFCICCILSKWQKTNKYASAFVSLNTTKDSSGMILPLLSVWYWACLDATIIRWKCHTQKKKREWWNGNYTLDERYPGQIAQLFVVVSSSIMLCVFGLYSAWLSYVWDMWLCWSCLSDRLDTAVRDACSCINLCRSGEPSTDLVGWYIILYIIVHVFPLDRNLYGSVCIYVLISSSLSVPII